MRKLIFGLIALAAGIGVGLFFGWYVWPVTYTEAAPSRMRQDWQDETIWMAAQSFAYERDLEAAQTRLRRLRPGGNLGQLVLDRAERAIEQQLPPKQISYL